MAVANNDTGQNNKIKSNFSLLSRRGVAFFVVLSVVGIMGIFVLFYFSFSRQFAASNFYHINRDRLKNITDVLLDSSFAYVQNETRDGSSVLSKKIIDQMRTGGSLNQTFDLKAPLFESVKSKLLNGLSLDYSIKGSIFDKRTRNEKGHPYYSGEGLGSLQIKLKAVLKTSSGKVLAACSRTRHFDLKSVCIVSSYKDRKTSYAMSFPLDYALLVRDGLREFKERPNGVNLNFGTRLILEDETSIPVSKRGWVYFGGSNENKKGSRVALNITDAPECTGLLPSLSTKRVDVSQAEYFKIFPEVEKAFNDNNLTVTGIKGHFQIYVSPMFRQNGSYGKCESNAKVILEKGPDGRTYATSGSVVAFAGPKDLAYLGSIFRGAITERFLYAVQFMSDYAGMVAEAKDGTKVSYTSLDSSLKFKLFNTSNFTSFDPNNDYVKNRPDILKFAKRVEQFVKVRNPPVSLYSKAVEELPYKSGQSISKNMVNSEIFGSVPDFYSRSGARLSSINATGGDGFRPFRHCSLYTTRFYHAKDLETNGIYDKKNGVLNLRGLISVEFEPVTLTPPSGKKEIIVKGQGAILSPYGFNISAGIKLNDPQKDMCILFTRKGSIRVTTSEKIEASLMAFNDSNSGTIRAQKSLDLFGALGVDRFYSNSFPSSVSKLAYDARFKAENKNEEVFSISISPWIRFEHIEYGRGIKIDKT